MNSESQCIDILVPIVEDLKSALARATELAVESASTYKFGEANPLWHTNASRAPGDTY
jgi:hypothetical protein